MNLLKWIGLGLGYLTIGTLISMAFVVVNDDMRENDEARLILGVVIFLWPIAVAALVVVGIVMGPILLAQRHAPRRPRRL